MVWKKKKKKKLSIDPLSTSLDRNNECLCHSWKRRKVLWRELFLRPLRSEASSTDELLAELFDISFAFALSWLVTLLDTVKLTASIWWWKRFIFMKLTIRDNFWSWKVVAWRQDFVVSSTSFRINMKTSLGFCFSHQTVVLTIMIAIKEHHKILVDVVEFFCFASQKLKNSLSHKNNQRRRRLNELSRERGAEEKKSDDSR